MKTRVVALVILALAGCGPRAAAPEPALPEPAAFASWPRATERPVPVPAQFWAFCRGPSPEEQAAIDAAAKKRGPHGEFTIVVRVSPDAIDAFRAGQPLPVGAVVIKEKYTDAAAAGALHAYAVMRKREAGYDPDGGDWEYGYVSQTGERQQSQGRLTECAGCHASVRGTDFLFRSYLADGR